MIRLAPLLVFPGRTAIALNIRSQGAPTTELKRIMINCWCSLTFLIRSPFSFTGNTNKGERLPIFRTRIKMKSVVVVGIRKTRSSVQLHEPPRAVVGVFRELKPLRIHAVREHQQLICHSLFLLLVLPTTEDWRNFHFAGKHNNGQEI